MLDINALIEDYFNAWVSRYWDIDACKEGRITSGEIKNHPVKSFKEYVKSKEPLRGITDISSVSQKFIAQTDRLVKAYNSLISNEKNIDMGKLERVLALVTRAIYGKHPIS